MHKLHIEYRTHKRSLSQDLATQLRKTGERGKVAIVAYTPMGLLAATRKQWVKITRNLQRERSSTVDATKIISLTRQIATMQSSRFSAKPPTDFLEADVTFARAEDFVKIPPICSTIYITYKFEKEKLYMLTSWMPEGGTVVVYD
jgi:hypothetical protein